MIGSLLTPQFKFYEWVGGWMKKSFAGISFLTYIAGLGLGFTFLYEVRGGEGSWDGLSRGIALHLRGVDSNTSSNKGL